MTIVSMSAMYAPSRDNRAVGVEWLRIFFEAVDRTPCHDHREPSEKRGFHLVPPSAVPMAGPIRGSWLAVTAMWREEEKVK